MRFCTIGTLLFSLIMVLVTAEKAETACNAFADGLRSLVSSTESGHESKACLICDHLLEWNDDGFISKEQIKTLHTRLSGETDVFVGINCKLKSSILY